MFCLTKKEIKIFSTVCVTVTVSVLSSIVVSKAPVSDTFPGINVISDFFGKFYAGVNKLARYANENNFSNRINIFTPAEILSKQFVANIDPKEKTSAGKIF